MPTFLSSVVSEILSSPLTPLFSFWMFAWVLMLFLGNPMIHWLKALKGMKWSPREDTPDSHLQKAGTPSMGGVGILGSAALAWVASLSMEFTLVKIAIGTGLSAFFFETFSPFLVCVMAHGVLGFADDWSKATRRGGLTSKQKLVGQVVLAALFLLVVRFLCVPLSIASNQDESHLLFGGGTFVLCLLLIIGTSNAVNLTDGIDGLAAGLSVQVGVVFGVLFLENWGATKISLFAQSAEMVWLALGGACLGFLAFNKNPAKVFMGDTGSLALGAALGAGAILTRSMFLLPFIGFVFYIEMFSVIAQVAYFKLTKRKTGEGKRIFRRAPLHHHFELGGWSEWRVVGTFWLVNALTTILGLILWKMGVLPRFP